MVLTARGDETDRVAGLELGADDYVVKPFSPKELVARVRAVLRRVEAATRPADRLVVGDLDVDLARHRVVADGRAVTLTPTEFEILATLAREPGRVFTRGQLLDAVHGFSLETYERAIDGHVKNLRRKLETDPGAPRYVRTVHGVGYALAEPEAGGRTHDGRRRRPAGSAGMARHGRPAGARRRRPEATDGPAMGGDRATRG